MLTTLRCCCLQLKNMDQIIIVVKNWPNDSCSNCKPSSNFKQYLKTKGFLVEVNYNLIKGKGVKRKKKSPKDYYFLVCHFLNITFLKKCRLTAINFVGLKWVCVSCGVWVGRELVLQLDRVFHRIGVQFPHKLFCFLWIGSCWFCLKRPGYSCNKMF